MGKFVNIILVIANIIILVFNVHFLCNEYPRGENLDLDYIGVIVGILSLLVTALLGWQIFNAITFENRIKKLEKKYKEKLKKASLYIDASAEFVQGVIVLSNERTIRYGVAYESFAISLLHYVESGFDVIKKSDNCISNMEYAFKKMSSDKDREYDYTNVEDAINNVIKKQKVLGNDSIKRLNNLEKMRKKFVGNGSKPDCSELYRNQIQLNAK